MLKMFIKRTQLIAWVCLVALSGCSSANQLTHSQKNHEGSISKKVLIHMDLETMFPDKQHRALARAAGKGQIKKIDELVSQGVDINSRGTSDATALFWAMKNEKGFEHLLKIGADPNVIFEDGGSVMHWVSRKKDCSMLILALKYEGNPNLKAGMFYRAPIFEMITVGKNDGIAPCFTTLLNNGADINSVDAQGKSPLLSAADLARYDIVYYLLKMGADYTLEDKSGRSINSFIESHEGAFRPDSLGESFRNKVKLWLEENSKNRHH
ncbi:Ankyrin repeat [Ferrimonas sediminum]|uniref:Ankyrin repeat n=1 Tax=Ferrimonas sediminum TaxID=718193 RepID=A0A1G9AGH3_9GAMM|nr:ankyrin repeat domain-containing protein [Ferrimonas sediminum]SDK26476.1 Ankyrin repeat [Ferrimonas sediminum]